MRLIDDCIYVLYVITYASGKKFGTNEILIFRKFNKKLLNAIYRQIMQKTSHSEHKYNLHLVIGKLVTNNRNVPHYNK